jgi:MFS family permease
LENKRNYILAFWDPVLFINGMIFLNVNTVIPYFLIALSGSTFHISLANFLAVLGSFLPSIFIARYVQKLRIKNKVFAKILFIQRFTFLIFVFLFPFILNYLGKTATIYLFLLFYGVFNLFVGTYGPFYFSILDKILPFEERGRVVGRGSALGNLIAIFMTLLLNFYINKISFPYNFFLIFLTGTFILILDALLFYFMEEKEGDIFEDSLSFSQFMRKAFSILKVNPVFRRVVISLLFLGLSLTALPYFIVYANKKFGSLNNIVTAFNFGYILSSVLGSFILGELTKNLGYKKVLSLGMALGLIGFIVVFTFRNLIGTILGSILVNLTFVSNILTSGFIITGVSTKEELPVYLAVSNTIVMAFSSLMHLLNGAIIKYLGFYVLFFVSFVFLVFSFVSIGRVVITSMDN